MLSNYRLFSLPLWALLSANLAPVLLTSVAIAQENLDRNLTEESPSEILPELDGEPRYDLELNVVDRLLNQVIYAPFRQDGTLKDATRPAYVITREQMEAQGYHNVIEALKYFPGVFIDSTQGNRIGANSSQILRGGSKTAQSLVLLDGRPLNEFDTGGFDLSLINVGDVERIEMIPGGSSTLYGSSAIGGVINIVSRQPELDRPWQGEAQVGGGTWGLNNQGIKVGYGSETAAFSLSYDRLSSDNDYGYNITNGNGVNLTGTRENAEATLQNLNFQAVGQVGDRTTLRFHGIYGTKEGGVPGSVDSNSFRPPTTGARAYSENLLLSLDLESRLGSEEQSVLTGRIFTDFVDFYNQNLQTAFPFDTSSKNQSVGGQIQHTLRLGDQHQLTYGGDYRHNQVLNRDRGTVRYDDHLSQGALFVQYGGAIAPTVDVNVGLRQDFNTLVDGSITSPSAGVLWRATDSTNLRANYGRNFRTPTAQDLYYPGASNPDLRPEIGRSFDVGVDQKLGDGGLLRLTYFHNTIDDGITLDPNNNFQPFNIGKARIQGLETELTVQLPQSFHAFANYTLNDSDILEDPNQGNLGNELPFAGTNYANLGLAYENPSGVYGGVFLKYVGDRLTDNSNTSQLNDYINVDLRGRYPLNDRVILTASWENIFDDSYQVFENYPGLGSRFRLGVQSRF